VQNQFFISMESTRKQIAAVLLLLFLAVHQSALGSLVIMLYHKDTMYLASDSLGTSFAYDDPSHVLGEASHSVQKISRISEHCCAAITGFAGHGIESKSGKLLISLDVPKSLGRLCALEATNSASLDEKMESIATKLNSEYCAFFKNGAQITGSAYEHDPTRLQFAGYNTEKRCFFVKSCVLDGTNSVHPELVKEYRGATDPNCFSLQGEARFLQTLMSGDQPELIKLLSPEFTDTAAELITDKTVSDGSVTNLILEMFRLHKENSARLGYDKGQIGPPYRIFKMTTEKIVELTSVPQTARATPSPDGADLHIGDDKAIEIMMQKLESTFMAGDYGYSIDVMYAPMVESMGGREALLTATKNVVVQMKQQNIVLHSWKAQKPYSYVKGESRLYAVISYESIMTIGGKKMRQESYGLGIKTGDSPWQFVNGDNLSAAMYKEFLPDFPKSFELPKVNRSYE
jgi:hypothetical protein